MEALPLLLGLETKIGEGLFSNDPGLGFFFEAPGPWEGLQPDLGHL